MALQIIGVILIVLGFILYRIRLRSEYKLTSFTIARETSIADLKSEFEEVSQDGIGKGHYKQLIALHGMVESPQPLISELSKTPCVKYRMVIDRTWEEEYESRNDRGQVEKKIRQGTTQVAQNEQQQPFFVRDETDSVRVSPEGAKIDLQKVLDRFEPETSATTISIGNFKLQVSGTQSGNRRYLGYHYQEWIFPIGQRVYIHGEVTDSGGELTFQKPSEPGTKEPYIITLKSKSELIHSTSKNIKILYYFSCFSFAIGVILLLIGLLK
ncbi:E3 ubiquitin ligase family protein [candidate division KSB1 bacterium]|nr:E3 ubiquitin ligase family protein [candidate division KSB1 bacterium]